MNGTKWFALATVLALCAVWGLSGPVMASSTKAVAEMARIGPEEAMKKAESNEALLVCAYDDDKCKTMLFEGALLRSELEAMLDTMPKTQEIIFY